METIKTYLENMFMNLPKNREVLHAKEELLNMMEDKYLELKNEGRTENEAVGIVISEFGNLNEVAEELGLSQTMKDASEAPERRVITSDLARDFISNRIRASYKVGIGVALAIWSPLLLILLSNSENQVVFGIRNGGTALGMVVLLSMVAMAVGLFIMSGVETGRYDLEKSGDFVLDHQAQSYVKIEEERYRMVKMTKITIGVVLCILSAVPLLVLGILEIGDNIMNIGVVLLLIIISIAVYLFITAGMKQSAYDILLKKGEYSEEGRRMTRRSETIGSVYWPIIVILYLYWSFTSGNWGFTWIIWPLAGLLFAAVIGLAGLLSTRNKME